MDGELIILSEEAATSSVPLVGIAAQVDVGGCCCVTATRRVRELWTTGQ